MTLGAYPSQSYYDPGRPSWLPYYIDTWDESARKWGLFPGSGAEPFKGIVPLPPAPAAPGAPQTRNEMTTPGAWTPQQAAAAGWAESQKQWQKFFDESAGVPVGNAPGMSSESVWFLVAAGLLVFMVVKR